MSTTAARPVRPAAQPVLLPFRHMAWRDLLGGLIGAFVPASATAFVLALNGGDVRPLAAAVVVTLTVIGFVAWRVLGARIALEADGLRLWSAVAQGRRIARADVTTVIDLPLFDEERFESSRQLFLVDARGRTLLRMNGRWWSDDQLAAVAQHVEAPLETIAESMTARELRRMRTVELQWFERHPAIRFIATAAAVSATCAVIGVATTQSLHGR